MATETGALAQKAGDPAVAAAYLELAAIWLKLADEVAHLATADENQPALRDQPGAP